MIISKNDCLKQMSELEKIYREQAGVVVTISPQPSMFFLVTLYNLWHHLIKKGSKVTFNYSSVGQEDLYLLKETSFPIKEEPYSSEKGRKDLSIILPISPIYKNENVPVLFRSVYEKIKSQGVIYNYKDKHMDDFLLAFSELAQNIPYHSQAPVGYISAIVKQEEYNHKAILAVSDLGIGVPKSLYEYQYQYPHYWNDSFAVTLALKERISRFKEIGRGKGLAGVYRIVKKLNGLFWLRSGKGFFVHNNEDYEAVELEYFMPGMQAYLELPLK